jgi:Ran GTPase-activating protein (RanGAP) involved in mRNA processing and transport
MNLGPRFAAKMTNFLKLDKIAQLNLSKNNIGDEGVEVLMKCLQNTRGLVSLNLSSNQISSAGFIKIFESMSFNESLIYLNISTLEGANRNRLSKKALNKFKQMLVKN